MPAFFRLIRRQGYHDLVQKRTDFPGRRGAVVGQDRKDYDPGSDFFRKNIITVLNFRSGRQDVTRIAADSVHRTALDLYPVSQVFWLTFHVVAESAVPAR